MSPRPFGLVPSSALQAFEARARQALRAWAEDWLCEGLPAPGLQAVRPDPRGDAPSDEGWLLAGERGSVWVAEGDVGVLARWLVPGIRPGEEARGGALLTRLGRQALDALLRRLLHAAQPGETEKVDAPASAPGAMPAQWLRPGAALVALRLTLGDAAIRVFHAGGLPRPAQPARPSPSVCEPLTEALSQQVVTLRADLGHIEMDLGALCRLGKGDVIRLAMPLDAPVPLQIDGHAGAAPVKGYLGAIDRHRALEIVAGP